MRLAEGLRRLLGLPRRPTETDLAVYNALNDTLASTFGLRSGTRVVETYHALRVATVYACVNLISGAIAQMPLRITAEGPMGRRPSRKMAERLINRSPSPLFTGPSFMEWAVQRVLLHGNAYVAILRDGAGAITELLPFDQSHVEVERRDGRLVYTLGFFDDMGSRQRSMRLDQDEVLHFVNAGELHNGRAWSVIEQGAARAVSIETQMENYVERYWEQGALQQYAVIKNGVWNKEQRENARRSFAQSYGQGAKGAFAPMVLDKTVEIKGLNMSARDSQLLESRDFQIDDIARAFRVPSHLINREQKTTSFGSGVSEISRSFLIYTLMPHIRRIEAELDRKLFPRTSETCRFDTTVLTRPTVKERYESYRTALGGGSTPGFLAINEVREMEGLPTLEGDEYEMPHTGGAAAPMAMEPEPEPPMLPEPPEPEPEPETDMEDDQ